MMKQLRLKIFGAADKEAIKEYLLCTIFTITVFSTLKSSTRETLIKNKADKSVHHSLSSNHTFPSAWHRVLRRAL